MKNNINPGVFLVLLIFWFCAFGYFWLILNFIITDGPYTIGDFRKHLVVSMGMSFIASIVSSIAIYYIIKFRNKVREEKKNNINFRRSLLVFIVAFFFHAYMWLFLHFAGAHEPFVFDDLKKHAVFALILSVIISIIWYFERKYIEKKQKEKGKEKKRKKT